MGSFRFQKKERLNKKKVIDELFKKGSSFQISPLRIIYLPHPQEELAAHQVLVSVPSRHFKKAVDRNTLKRRIREGYRLNKALLPFPPTFCLAYIYTAKETLPSTAIHKAIQASLERLRHHEKKD